MIREIGAADRTGAAAVVAMLPRLQDELGLPVPFAEATAAATVAALAASDRGLVLMLDLDGPKGMMLAAAQPYAFAPVLAAEEIAWWIDSRHRGPWAARMLDRFEAWAAAIGAGITGLSDTGKSAAALYRRRGYVPAERTYFRIR